jgi:hypothetical protein
MQFVPTAFEVTVLSSPTENALLRTVVKRRRHLQALMRLYSVELLFVTISVVNQRFV